MGERQVTPERPKQRVARIRPPQTYALPSRPPESAGEAAQDAYRQTRFLLSNDLDVFAEAMELQLKLVADANPSTSSKYRTLELAAISALWSRAYAGLADAMLLVSRGSYASSLPLISPAVELARSEGVTLVVETGNGTMVNSCWTARKLIDDLGAKDTLQVLWDPANSCWAHEVAWPDGYETLTGGYLGHVHIKDVQVDTPKAYLEVRRMGEGQLADQFASIADALRADGYDGVISFESVYHPGDGDYEAGFRSCIGKFMQVFG